MTPSCYLDQKVILKNFVVTLIANILILSLNLGYKKKFYIVFDTKIRRVNKRFYTSVYCKLTFRGVFTNFESFVSLPYKSNFIFTLLFRAFKLCSSFELFH